MQRSKSSPTSHGHADETTEEHVAGKARSLGPMASPKGDAAPVVTLASKELRELVDSASVPLPHARNAGLHWVTLNGGNVEESWRAHCAG